MWASVPLNRSLLSPRLTQACTAQGQEHGAELPLAPVLGTQQIAGAGWDWVRGFGQEGEGCRGQRREGQPGRREGGWAACSLRADPGQHGAVVGPSLWLSALSWSLGVPVSAAAGAPVLAEGPGSSRLQPRPQAPEAEVPGSACQAWLSVLSSFRATPGAGAASRGQPRASSCTCLGGQAGGAGEEGPGAARGGAGHRPSFLLPARPQQGTMCSVPELEFGQEWLESAEATLLCGSREAAGR